MAPDEPPRAARSVARVLENRPIARDTFRLRLGDPELARAIRPGQFMMVRPAQGAATDPLLGRPFALYDVIMNDRGEPIAIDLVYQVVGRGTAVLAKARPGDDLITWGPLGNGFGPPPGGDVAFVAGGIGQTPFLALARAWLGGDGEARCRSATLFYGLRTADLAAGVDDFRAAGVAVELATDDGSIGHRGFVTDLLAARLDRGERFAKVIGCGPPPMLAALTRLVRRHAVPCDLSLENHMACGFGACFSCVAPIRQDDGSVDLRRVCIEGPIYPASAVVWGDGDLG